MLSEQIVDMKAGNRRIARVLVWSTWNPDKENYSIPEFERKRKHLPRKIYGIGEMFFVLDFLIFELILSFHLLIRNCNLKQNILKGLSYLGYLLKIHLKFNHQEIYSNFPLLAFDSWIFKLLKLNVKWKKKLCSFTSETFLKRRLTISHQFLPFY